MKGHVDRSQFTCNKAEREKTFNKLVDTHAHLEEVEDLDQALKRAERAGVTAIITMGSDHKSNKWALKISEKQRSGKVKVYAALGIHPWGLDASKIDSALNFIRENVERAVGVREIGLDYWLRDVTNDGAAWETNVFKLCGSCRRGRLEVHA